MDIRQITPAYSVSPQIEPSDIPAIASAGYTTVICNRPDLEIPPSLQADVIRQASEAAGLAFVYLPLTHDTIEEKLSAQVDAIASSDGPVFAYCASGTRCSVIWSYAQVGVLPVDDIMAATRAAGYDLSMLLPQLSALSKNKG